MSLPSIDEYVRSVEINLSRLATSPTIREEDLLRVAVQVLTAEKKMEEELAKVKDDKERKELEMRLLKVKEMRDKVIRLYIALLLRGKSRKPLSLFEVRWWPI